jgi:hypothetical protein
MARIRADRREWAQKPRLGPARPATGSSLTTRTCWGTLGRMPPAPSNLLSTPDARARLALARHHLDEAVRALGGLPAVSEDFSAGPLDEFPGVCSWHEHMKDVFDVVLEVGEHGMDEHRIARTAQSMERMGALLQLAEPFDDAAARLRATCRSFQDEVYGPIWECEDRLRALAKTDLALAAKLRAIGLLADVEEDPVGDARDGRA